MTDTTTILDNDEPTGKELAAVFLLGEMIKTATKHLKTLAVPWIDLRESEQASILRTVESDCRRMISDAVDVIASNARLTFKAQVTQVTFKDGVKAQLELLNSPHAHALADAVANVVTVVIEDRGTLLEVGDALTTDPDQTPLFDQAAA